MDCFISYATTDAEVAKRLFERLTAAGVTTFLAEATVEIGEDWPSVIRASACRAEVLVLLDSEASRRSAAVQQEAGMALASGSLLIPVSLDGRFDRLPGWLAGIQATRAIPGPGYDAAISAIVDRVRAFLHPELGGPGNGAPRLATVGDCVLRTVLLDQFTAPPERRGAWSRQYDRYLNMYWGPGPRRSDISQGASLTFTGMIIERLTQYARSGPAESVQLARLALERAEFFILSSQHPSEGGFGRRSIHRKTRAQHDLELDVRHTCWAVRALLSIDSERFHSPIQAALEWLSLHVQRRAESDRWCWTTAPLLALLNDERALSFACWSRQRNSTLGVLEDEIEKDFCPLYGSWVSGELPEKKQWVATDNALYVLYTLAKTDIVSERIREHVRMAVKQLMTKARRVGTDELGIPLFTDEPEVGPTAQLIEILSLGRHEDDNMVRAEDRRDLLAFVLKRLNTSSTMPLTFSWHLSSALSVPALAGQAYHFT